MKKTLVIILSILLFIAAVFGIWKYACHRASVSDTLPRNTIINGVDCSGISKDEAVRKLTDKMEFQRFSRLLTAAALLSYFLCQILSIT